MATIINTYDLSGGNTTSTAVVNPVDVRFQYTIAGATDTTQAVYLVHYVSEDATNWAPLVDEYGMPIKMLIKGNDSLSRNIVGINASNLKVVAEVPDGAVGTLTVLTKES